MKGGLPSFWKHSIMLDRDHNAAVNILGLGLQSLGINP